MFAMRGGIAGEGVVGVWGCWGKRSCVCGESHVREMSPIRGRGLLLEVVQGSKVRGTGSGAAEVSGLTAVDGGSADVCPRVMLGGSSQAARNIRIRSRSEVGDWDSCSGVGGDGGMLGTDSPDLGLAWVSSIVRESGEDGGSCVGDALVLLHESWELEGVGEAAVRTTEGVFSFCVRWSSLCFSASLAVMDTAQGEHT